MTIGQDSEINSQPELPAHALCRQAESLSELSCIPVKALLEREARLRDFSEAASDWLWETGPDLNITYMSDRVTDFTGIAANWYLNRPMLVLAAAGQDPAAADELSAAVAKHQPFTDYQFSWPDTRGQMQWYLASGKPVFDGDGTFAGYRGVARRITQIKEAELRNQMAFAMLNSTGDAVFALDLDRRVVSWNPAAERLFSLTRETVLGQRLDEMVCPNSHPCTLTTLISRAFAGDPIEDVELRIDTADGEPVVLSVTLSPMTNDDDGQTGICGVARDIRHRIEAERAIRDGARQLQLVADGVPAAISYIDAAYRFGFVNALQAAWYDFSSETLVGKPVVDVLGPHVFALLQPHMAQALAGSSQEYETERTYPDGATRTVNVRYVPHESDAGTVLGFFVLATDVSKARQVEAEARANARQLQLVTDAMPALIAYCDRDHVYRFANKAATRYYDRPLDEIIGHTAEELLGEEAVEMLLPYADRAYAGEQVSFEGSRRFPDGIMRHYQTTYVPDLDGRRNVRGFFILLVDITRRKLAEERVASMAQQLKLVVDAVPAMVAYCDRDKIYRIVNGTMAEWIGLPAEEIVGRNPLEIFGPENHERMRDVMQRVLGGERVIDETMRRFPDGRERALETTLVPDVGTDGTVKGWFALGVDVTEHRRVQVRLEQQSNELEQLNRQKDRLFSIIAHDLRGAFNAILGFSELMQLPAIATKPDDMLRYAALLNQAGQQGHHILSDLVQWSRSQLSNVEPEIAVFDLADLGTSLFEIQSAAADTAEVSLVLDVPPGTKVRSDPGVIKTVLRNLMSNSIKFTPSGGTVTLSASLVDGECLLAVADTGIGMDKTLQADALTLGSKSSRVGLHGETGSGLGLQICKELLNHLGSALHVESTPGTGSRFYFTVPLSGRDAG